jgi:hypothetical protein
VRARHEARRPTAVGRLRSDPELCRASVAWNDGSALGQVTRVRRVRSDRRATRRAVGARASRNRSSTLPPGTDRAKRDARTAGATVRGRDDDRDSSHARPTARPPGRPIARIAPTRRPRAHRTREVDVDRAGCAPARACAAAWRGTCPAACTASSSVVRCLHVALYFAHTRRCVARPPVRRTCHRRVPRRPPAPVCEHLRLSHRVPPAGDDARLARPPRADPRPSLAGGAARAAPPVTPPRAALDARIGTSSCRTVGGTSPRTVSTVFGGCCSTATAARASRGRAPRATRPCVAVAARPRAW